MNHTKHVGLAMALIFTSVANALGHGEQPPAPGQPKSEPSGRPQTARVDGQGALALAGIAAAASPNLSAAEKEAVGMLFAGNSNISYSKKIVVTTDKIVCRVSNVDITSRSCELTFGETVKTISGRAAYELYATELMAGVPSEGAAGTIYVGLSKLHCTIDPREIKAGGGAECTFQGEED